MNPLQKALADIEAINEPEQLVHHARRLAIEMLEFKRYTNGADNLTAEQWAVLSAMQCQALALERKHHQFLPGFQRSRSRARDFGLGFLAASVLALLLQILSLVLR